MAPSASKAGRLARLVIVVLKMLRSWAGSPVSRASLLLSVIGTAALFMMDLGFVFTVNGLTPDNGFFKVPASKLYHIALYIALGCLWLLALRK